MTQSKTVFGLKPSPSMASFSSRGPNTIEESILKVWLIIQSLASQLYFVYPFFRFEMFAMCDFWLFVSQPDIIAPGVNIIAAYSEDVAPSTELFDKRRVPYITLSGTSMACPHVSGLVGLLKTLYPDWSPAAIKSAIMTTGIYINFLRV